MPQLGLPSLSLHLGNYSSVKWLFHCIKNELPLTLLCSQKGLSESQNSRSSTGTIINFSLWWYMAIRSSYWEWIRQTSLPLSFPLLKCAHIFHMWVIPSERFLNPLAKKLVTWKLPANNIHLAQLVVFSFVEGFLFVCVVCCGFFSPCCQ